MKEEERMNENRELAEVGRKKKREEKMEIRTGRGNKKIGNCTDTRKVDVDKGTRKQILV
jgi:hypothetical protein